MPPQQGYAVGGQTLVRHCSGTNVRFISKYRRYKTTMRQKHDTSIVACNHLFINVLISILGENDKTTTNPEKKKRL